MPFTTGVATDLAALERLAPAWDELADAVRGPLFSRPFWGVPWARHLRHGRPHVVTVTEAGELVALAPVSLRSVGGVELVRFLGHGLGTVSALLVRPDHPGADAALWAGMLGGRRRFAQLIELRAPDAAGVVPPDWPHVVEPHDTCPTVACAPGWEAYLAARPKKLRENLRRAERALAGAGQGLAVEVVTDVERWRAVRAEVVRVFDAAEVAQPRQHLFRGALTPFVDDFLETSARAGRLRLFVGRIDGDPVSFGIAFAEGDTLSYWITRFDPAHAHASIGILLLREIVEHACSHGFATVDLLLGDQGHKRRWRTDTYDTLTVLAASNRPLLRLGEATLATADRWRRRR